MRRLFGDRPWMVLLVVSPTLLAMAMDPFVRARSLVHLPALDVANYFGSALAASGIWGGSLWLISRLFLVRAGRARVAARAALALFFGGLFLPFAFFAYGGQALYYRVFHAYIARDTVRLGIRLRGTVLTWLASWGAGLVLMAVLAVVLTALVAWLVRRAAAPLAAAWPVVPVLGFAASAFCLWNDLVESRALQAAPPDACFLHGTMHALHLQLTARGRAVRGVTLRIPDPLPPLTPPAHRPNIVVILSESVRADALCSERRAGCQAPFLDEAAPDRIPLGDLTSQASGTFISCMVLWTGLPPDADFETAHRAPMLWELARAVGYRTAYISAQNLRYEDLAAYVERAGIDVKAGAVELGDALDPQIGAADENATARVLSFVRDVPDGQPYFALLHFSNTHAPYRVDPALQPFEPHDDDPLGDVQKLHNHYLNGVRLQERTVSAFLRELRATPRWDDTVVLFLSDHGEEFREHGRLYHLNYLYDEEVRVPGWLLAGPRALDDAQRAALPTFAGRRTYTQDVQATVVDLLGLFDQRGSLPFASLVTGRSLVRPCPTAEPIAFQSTTSGVWEDDDPYYGARRGRMLVVGTDSAPFACYDSVVDPLQRAAMPLRNCGWDLVRMAQRRFPWVPRPPP